MLGFRLSDGRVTIWGTTGKECEVMRTSLWLWAVS